MASGRAVSVKTRLDVAFKEFKQVAERALSVGRDRLLDGGGRVLEGRKTIEECGLQTDKVLTLHLRVVMILRNRS